jgi:hypothetical protein
MDACPSHRPDPAQAADHELEAEFLRLVRELAQRAERAPTRQERGQRRAKLQRLIARLQRSDADSS